MVETNREHLRELTGREDVARAMALVDENLRSMVADIINISQIPAPTFDEGDRANLIEKLYRDLNVGQVVRDDVGNLISRVSVGEGGPNIYLTAHMDTHYPKDVDHTATLDDVKITGPSVADSSVGLAALLCLARVIKETPLKLAANIYCVSTVGSLGKGYSAGIRAIVEDRGEDIDVVIGVEGVELGRIGYFSQGCRFLDVVCNVKGGDPWLEPKKASAIRVIAEIIHKVENFKLPPEPQAIVNVGLMEGGEDYDKIAAYARCGLEVRSTDVASLRHLENRIRFWANKIAAKMEAHVEVESVRRHPSGSIPEDHFLVELAKEVNSFLNVEPAPGAASPNISVPLSHGIPSVTLAITEGTAKKGREAAYVNPISTGVKQLLLTILTLDSKWEEYTTLPVW